MITSGGGGGGQGVGFERVLKLAHGVTLTDGASPTTGF